MLYHNQANKLLAKERGNFIAYYLNTSKSDSPKAGRQEIDC